MLSVLSRQLKEGEKIRSFSYRNLAPLYAQEEMRVCLKRDREKTEKFEVWIEGRSGGYTVKGSATIAKIGPEREGKAELEPGMLDCGLTQS
jgi:hydroxyacyl-ACP dehydratase HTD2-like protein with hotdog domain